MQLSRTAEWVVFLPGILFGRHVLPILVVLISLFIDFEVGLYLGLCWYENWLVYIVVL